MVNRSSGKLLVYEIPPNFDSKAIPNSSRKFSTLQNFLERCMSLAKDLDALKEIASLLYR